jgi:hypothetical protein
MQEAPKPIGSRIRSFIEQLFTSRHVRFLEAELVRARLEYQAEIRYMKAEKDLLCKKIEKLELAVWPQATQAGRAWAAGAAPRPQSSTLEVPSGEATFLEALRLHNQKEDREWQRHQSESSSTKENGPAAAGK